jgi:hypothetical protein
MSAHPQTTQSRELIFARAIAACETYAERWRARAEECRAAAKAMHDPDARRAMLITSAGYELLAQNACNRRAMAFVMTRQLAHEGSC